MTIDLQLDLKIDRADYDIFNPLISMFNLCLLVEKFSRQL